MKFLWDLELKGILIIDVVFNILRGVIFQYAIIFQYG